VGRKYERTCDHCGTFYRGEGRKFCSPKCDRESRQAPAEPRAPNETPASPDENLRVAFDGEWGHVSVAASSSIKTPEELIEKAGIDTAIWEPHEPSVRKWDTIVKIGDDAVVVPLFYVSVKLRKRWEATELPRPVVLRVTRPMLRKPSVGPFTSVHYSDIHFPFHDEQALNLLYQILDYVRPGLTVDHGDTLDCTEISKYPKDPFNRVPLNEETAMGARHNATVHAITPNSEHAWLEGNHEERLKRLIWAAAERRDVAELLAVPKVREALTWGQLLGLDSLGWECVPYPHHKLLFDRMILAHGDTTGGDVAKKLLLRFGKSGISGHTHKRNSAETRDYNGHHAWFEIGMLGRIRDDYKFFPDWAQGLGVVTWSDDRKAFGFEQLRIHDGVCYFRGKRFEGNSKELAA
jgi:hypothetical protein